MDREEAKKLYEGKYFYEIVKDEEQNCVRLYGPFDNIYYVNPIMKDSKYKFLQVVDGKPVAAFTEQEILVTDRIL